MDNHLCEFCISNSTLYYFFSTIAQVLAATTALSAIFIHVKINDVKRFLIGTGKAMLTRIYSNEEGYKGLKPIQINQLRDNIDKEDFDGIEDILKRLTNMEIEKGVKKEDHPTGFQGINERYKNQRELIRTLNKLMKVAIIFSLITIFTSIICLSLVDLINQKLIISIASMVLVLILMIISLWKTHNAITKGLD